MAAHDSCAFWKGGRPRCRWNCAKCSFPDLLRWTIRGRNRGIAFAPVQLTPSRRAARHTPVSAAKRLGPGAKAEEHAKGREAAAAARGRRMPWRDDTRERKPTKRTVTVVERQSCSARHRPGGCGDIDGRVANPEPDENVARWFSGDVTRRGVAVHRSLCSSLCCGRATDGRATTCLVVWLEELLVDRWLLPRQELSVKLSRAQERTVGAGAPPG